MASQKLAPPSTMIYLVISPYGLATPPAAYTDPAVAQEAANAGGCTVSPAVLYHHQAYVCTLDAHLVNELTSSQQRVCRTQR